MKNARASLDKWTKQTEKLFRLKYCLSENIKYLCIFHVSTKNHSLPIVLNRKSYNIKQHFKRFENLRKIQIVFVFRLLMTIKPFSMASTRKPSREHRPNNNMENSAPVAYAVANTLFTTFIYTAEYRWTR